RLLTVGALAVDAVVHLQLADAMQLAAPGGHRWRGAVPRTGSGGDARRHRPPRHRPPTRVRHRRARGAERPGAGAALHLRPGPGDRADPLDVRPRLVPAE